MLEDRLTIPLNQPHPARQRFWRAVWLVALISLGVLAGIITYRLITLRNPLLAWPENSVMALRLPKTPENLTDISLLLPGIIAGDNLPLSLSNELRHSRSEIVIFFAEDGTVTGLATDRRLSELDKTKLNLLGLQTTAAKQLTTLSVSPAPSSHRLFTPWLVWPSFDGSLNLLKNDKIQSTPLIITSESITLRGDFSPFQNSSSLSLDEQTNLLATFAAPPDLAANLLPSVPSAFPGSKSLISAMESGFSLVLGLDQTGPAYALELTGNPLDHEQLGQITEELVQTTNLSTQDWTINSITFNELRAEEVEVTFAHDVNLNRIVATALNGDLVRATQTTQATIISNRQTNIKQQTTAPDSCLPKANSFIAPAGLRQLLGPVQIYQVSDLGSLLQKSDRLSWSKSRLKICF